MIGKYKLLVNDEIITSSNSYDKILDKFVKEVTKQEKVHLNKNECIRVTIKNDERVYLENCIRGQEEKEDIKVTNIYTASDGKKISGRRNWKNYERNLKKNDSLQNKN